MARTRPRGGPHFNPGALNAQSTPSNKRSAGLQFGHHQAAKLGRERADTAHPTKQATRPGSKERTAGEAAQNASKAGESNTGANARATSGTMGRNAPQRQSVTNKFQRKFAAGNKDAKADRKIDGALLKSEYVVSVPLDSEAAGRSSEAGEPKSGADR